MNGSGSVKGKIGKRYVSFYGMLALARLSDREFARFARMPNVDTAELEFVTSMRNSDEIMTRVRGLLESFENLRFHAVLASRALRGQVISTIVYQHRVPELSERDGSSGRVAVQRLAEVWWELEQIVLARHGITTERPPVKYEGHNREPVSA